MSSNTDLTIKYRSASSPIPPFLPTNPFYDVNNWDCYAKTSSRGGGSSWSISTDVSMELEFFCEEALTPDIKQVIEEHRNECFRIINGMKRLNNCLKRKREAVRKLLKTAERYYAVDHQYVEQVKASLRSNEKIQLMFRNYAYHKWTPYQGTRPREWSSGRKRRR